MITTIITLFALTIFFAVLSFASFILVIVGFIKKRKNLWTISLAICLVSIFLFSVTVIYTGKKAVNRTYITTRMFSEKGISSIVGFLNPDIITFTRSTGLEWPENAKIITSGHENYLFDWEFYLVFEADQDVLETWLSTSPPWGVKEWTPGPISPTIPYKIFNSYSDGNIPEDFKDNSNTWYVVKEYCCDDDEFQRFDDVDLLIIELDSNRVWLIRWKH